ncbi:MAG: cysteine desulfurase-like protein [Candidatus Eremiobacteraeota bacterium]|nr:cysteine desulfurase-like protein [Candidatus Eremiobacteraeota bacterium]
MHTRATLAARARPLFPALRREVAGRPVAYFDGPGGTQVPRSVVDAMSEYLLQHNANDGWAFATSRETDAALTRARANVATFINAASPGEIVFGANMTTLAFHIARAIGRSLRPGDEIVVTELDHHANIDPWLALERDYGAVVKYVPLLENRPEMDIAAYERLLGPRTRLVAVGLSSNAFGTINPVARMTRAAHAVGALVFVDAVHAAAHAALDVRALDADMLAFSAYKVYGPHVGIAYCRDELLERLEFPRLRPQERTGSKRAETGTLNHEGIVGAGAAIDFLAGLSGSENTAAPRERIVATMNGAHAEEQIVFDALRAGLRTIPGVALYEPSADAARHPTLAITFGDRDAGEIAAKLSNADGVFVSHGNFYAQTAVAKVAPAATACGGLLRAGVGLYSTLEDAERLVGALRRYGANGRAAN